MPRKKKNTTESTAGNIDSESQKKHVLIAILGTAPAVLTETVWVLATQKGIVPDEIVVFTTQKGKVELQNQILTPDGRRACAWTRLQKALAATGCDVKDKLVFDIEGSVHLFKNKRRVPIPDLRSREDNLEAANMMMKEIREYADDGDCVIHALLAGGRKTMTALFFSCMSLLARSCDRIYHVLASDKYEKRLNPAFCFPEKGVVHEYVEEDNKGKKKTVSLKSEDAKINLFEVPFVYMGEWAEQRCRAISKNLSYENLINAVQKSFNRELFPDRVVLDFTQGKVEFDGKVMKLSGVEFMVLSFLMQGYSQQDVITKMNNLKNYMREEDEDDRDRVFRKGVKDALPWLYKMGWKNQKVTTSITQEHNVARGEVTNVETRHDIAFKQAFLHDDVNSKVVEGLLLRDFGHAKNVLRNALFEAHQDSFSRLLFEGNLHASAGAFNPATQVICRMGGVPEGFMEYFFPEDAPYKLKEENES